MSRTAAVVSLTAAHSSPSATDHWRLACEVADVLAGMTYDERIRAYGNRVFTPRELAIAAARLPDEMPMLNGELEWIAFDLE
jgi:hypothetical protein